MMETLNGATNGMSLKDRRVPDSAKLNNHYILGEIIEDVQNFKIGFPHIDFDELIDQLTQVRDHNVNAETQVRGFIKVFANTPFFEQEISKLDPTIQAQLRAFIDGQSAAEIVGKSDWPLSPSPAAKHHFSLLQFFEKLGSHDKAIKHVKEQELPCIYEDATETKIMEVHSDLPFENWGLSVQNTPRYTFVPTTVLGLQNLVLYAKKHSLRVRVAGYRHSWSPTFSETGQIFVSLLNLKQVTETPDASSLGPSHVVTTGNELKIIELAPESLSSDPKKRLVRVGVSVTNEEFRRWALANGAWTLPMDVILVEVTIGGVNGPICHGAGRRHQTLSDQVRQIEYIDVNGKQQTVSDPKLLKAAAGCFGLLGIVTHITFELEAMTYAVMKPRKPDIGLAIPPLSQSEVPAAIKKMHTDVDVKSAIAQFEDQATNDYYSEWFWFPYQQTAWVNCWNNTTDATGVVDYPNTSQVWLQWVQGWIGGVMMASEFFAALPPHWQAQLLATGGMAVLPPTLFEKPTPEIKTWIPNALHFRRGVQNSRVRDMEMQIPLPPLAHDPTKPDLTVVRKAWWDVINLVYAESDTSPLRLTLELRIMGGSNIIMAPQYGNDLGTASIEILTSLDTVNDDIWSDFCQKVYDKWAQYGFKKANGEEVRVRPHWAKEWDGMSMGGQAEDARKYLKAVVYKERIGEFKERLQEIGAGQGWSLGDLKARFSNELWDEMIFS